MKTGAPSEAGRASKEVALSLRTSCRKEAQRRAAHLDAGFEDWRRLDEQAHASLRSLSERSGGLVLAALRGCLAKILEEVVREVSLSERRSQLDAEPPRPKATGESGPTSRMCESGRARLHAATGAIRNTIDHGSHNEEARRVGRPKRVEAPHAPTDDAIVDPAHVENHAASAWSAEVPEGRTTVSLRGGQPKGLWIGVVEIADDFT